MDIKDLKWTELEEILDFYNHVEEYGHIFHHDPETLNEPFRKIMEGIEEVRKLMNESWSM